METTRISFLAAFEIIKVIDKIVHNVPELNSPYEKADMSLVLHAAEEAEAGSKRLVVLSADTDILVLMLYNWRELERKGLNELWFPWFQAVGRCIPIHKLAIKLGADFQLYMLCLAVITAVKPVQKQLPLKKTLLCI